MDKEFTSAKITTQRDFTFGRIEIRAALPKGKLLRPAMFMIPIKSTGVWPKDGQIDIMTNVQNQIVANGIHYESSFDYKHIYKGQEYEVNDTIDLNQFHTYAIERTETEIRWYFDDINTFSVRLDKLSNIYGKPFDSGFRLVIHLGVGGSTGGRDFFPNQILSAEDVYEWNCSLLILDYVRFYSHFNYSLPQEVDQTSRDYICGKVMPSIRPPKPDLLNNNFRLITIISIIIGILLSIIISIVIYLYIRRKKLKSNDTQINSRKMISDYNNEINGKKLFLKNF